MSDEIDEESEVITAVRSILADYRAQSEKDKASEFYLIFISLIFGVLVSVWIVPIGELFRTEYNDTQIMDRLASWQNFRGMVLYGILICLWWWYGRFLGKLAPAMGFSMFAYDFISLGAFAVAFRIWPQQYASPLAIAIAAILMLVRFAYARKDIGDMGNQNGCTAQRAITWALVVLTAFACASFLGISGMLVILLNLENPDEVLGVLWIVIRTAVTVLLIFGIGVTVYAAHLTEGLGWGRPRGYEEWLGLRKPSDKQPG